MTSRGIMYDLYMYMMLLYDMYTVSVVCSLINHYKGQSRSVYIELTQVIKIRIEIVQSESKKSSSVVSVQSCFCVITPIYILWFNHHKTVLSACMGRSGA